MDQADVGLISGAIFALSFNACLINDATATGNAIVAVPALMLGFVTRAFKVMQPIPLGFIPLETRAAGRGVGGYDVRSPAHQLGREATLPLWRLVCRPRAC